MFKPDTEFWQTASRRLIDDTMLSLPFAMLAKIDHRPIVTQQKNRPIHKKSTVPNLSPYQDLGTFPQISRPLVPELLLTDASVSDTIYTVMAVVAITVKDLKIRGHIVKRYFEFRTVEPVWMPESNTTWGYRTYRIYADSLREAWDTVRQETTVALEVVVGR